MDRRCRPVYGKGVLALKIGFDNQKYIELQKQHIQERISKFKGKL